MGLLVCLSRRWRCRYMLFVECRILYYHWRWIIERIVNDRHSHCQISHDTLMSLALYHSSHLLVYSSPQLTNNTVSSRFSPPVIRPCKSITPNSNIEPFLATPNSKPHSARKFHLTSTSANTHSHLISHALISRMSGDFEYFRKRNWRKPNVSRYFENHATRRDPDSRIVCFLVRRLQGLCACIVKRNGTRGKLEMISMVRFAEPWFLWDAPGFFAYRVFRARQSIVCCFLCQHGSIGPSLWQKEVNTQRLFQCDTTCRRRFGAQM